MFLPRALICQIPYPPTLPMVNEDGNVGVTRAAVLGSPLRADIYIGVAHAAVLGSSPPRIQQSITRPYCQVLPHQNHINISNTG